MLWLWRDFQRPYAGHFRRDGGRQDRSLKESGAHKVLSADCGCLMNINGSLEKQKEALRGQHLASFWQRTGGAR
jgi:hypothetical protein